MILNWTSPTDRPGRPREPGPDPVRSDRPTRSGPRGGGDVGPEPADRPTLLADQPGRRAGSGETDRPTASDATSAACKRPPLSLVRNPH